MSQKAVVVFSGGMDSTVLLYLLKSTGYALYPISFDYGQRHVRELAYAKHTCAKWHLPHHVVNLRSLRNLLSGSALTSDEVEVPHGHYAADNMKLTVVPNRNAIMLSVAWGYAISIGAQLVATAVHAGDHAVYPDCRPEFIKSLDKAFTIGTAGFGDDNLCLYTPFIHNTKTSICKQGHVLDVPWTDTWSCYEGKTIHCGKCGTCVERREAFNEAKVDDPTNYEVDHA